LEGGGSSQKKDPIVGKRVRKGGVFGGEKGSYSKGGSRD